MSFGDDVLQRGSNGAEVVELQLRLSGFRGTSWDGDFGPGTELQVNTFQRDVMGLSNVTGIADQQTVQALFEFANQHPIDFDTIRCPCGECGGFGQGRFAGEYRSGKPEIEAYHQREYPGIHKAILHAYRAATFYLVRDNYPTPILSSGYRCWINNEQKNRVSTNHMGKALDVDFPLPSGEDKRDDGKRCDAARGLLVERANFQIGWSGGNCKALEPSNIAPTWVHMDVRCFSTKYLADQYFVTTADALDSVNI
jgi:hypothetical protein